MYGNSKGNQSKGGKGNLKGGKGSFKGNMKGKGGGFAQNFGNTRNSYGYGTGYGNAHGAGSDGYARMKGSTYMRNQRNTFNNQLRSVSANLPTTS